MADPICAKNGDCSYTIPKGRIVKQNQQTETRVLTKQQAKAINFCKIDLSRATQITLETPKNGEKSLILSVEQPKVKLPLKPDDIMNYRTHTDYCSTKNGLSQKVLVDRVLSSGDVTKSEATSIEVGNNPICGVSKMTMEPSAAYLQRHQGDRDFLEKNKDALTPQTQYLFCTAKGCDPTTENNYNISFNSIPRYNSNGELIR